MFKFPDNFFLTVFNALPRCEPFFVTLSFAIITGMFCGNKKHLSRLGLSRLQRIVKCDLCRG